MELEDSSDADRDGLIDNPGILLAAGVIQKGIQRELKTFLVRQDNEFAVTSNDGTTRMYDAMVDNRIGRLQSERGPPDAEGKQLPIRNYRYDDSSKTRTAYDLLTLTYSVTTFENELPGEVLSQGRFEILDDGSYRHIDKSETPDADEVSVYRYDAVEVLDFEYAFDIITQGQPAAALVRNVNLDQLNRLLNLPFEVGVAVRDGLILLFTSGDSQEIRLLDAVRGIVEDADLIAHFQTKQGGARQDGPSQGDFDMATDKIEYVLTTQGVFSYNRNGVTDTFAVEEFHSRLSDLLNSEKESPASVEVFSRLLLNQFITAMDRLSEFGEEEILRFRAGDYTPEEEEAFEFAEDELELRILKDRSDFEREDIQNTAANIYRLKLRNEITVYTYDVNIATSETTFISEQEDSIEQEYDDFGRVSRLRNLTKGKTYLYEYDEAGGKVDVVDVGSSTFQRAEYDFSENVQGRVFATGTVDPNNQKIVISTFDYSVAGQVAVVDLTQGTYTIYGYDNATDRTKAPIEGGTVDQNGVKTKTINYDYSVGGRVTIEDLSANTYTTYAYNADREKIGQAEEGGVIEGDGSRRQNTFYDYSVSGKVTVENSDEQTYTTYIYNNQLRRSEEPVEGGTINQDGSRTKTQEYDYSVAGQVIVKDLVNGTYTAYEYDSETNQMGDAIEGGTFDANGIRTKTQEYDYSVPDQVIVKDLVNDTYTAYEYDSETRQIGDAIEGGTFDVNGVRTKTQEYDYSVLGQVIVKDLVNDTYTVYEYDDETRRIGDALEGGTIDANGVRTKTQEYDYSIPGQVLLKDLINNTYTAYEYDSENRQIGDAVEGGTFDQNGVRTKTQEYDYSVTGQVIVKNLENDTYTSYVYEGATRSIGVALEGGTFDANGVLTKTQEYDYSVPGQVIVKDLVNDTHNAL